ncbi:MAG: DNA-directed RNA polymerase subunit alpha [Armatimonadota bacterium]|nr:MAG: DNA-directed RNA polymerase subunit alpha [Armatimonadota bacterium]
MIDTLTPRIERLDDGSVPDFGEFAVEPLERGYGTTLGSALRRVLLSSIPGAAITFVTIENVLHEFSTIPGVVEDVTEILLNLKELGIKVLEAPAEPDLAQAPAEGPRILRIERTGPGEVLGADVETPSDVEIVNKDRHIAALDSADASLSIQMEVERGRGYVAAEEHDASRRPIGAIPVDSIFTPVRRVGFRVEPTRVGHMTDFDRLIIEVTTNGAIDPADAISDAAKILDRYLILFFDFQQQEEELAGVPEVESAVARQLQTRIEDLDFSVRTSNCLRREGIGTIGELVQRTESDLMAIRNFGRKSLQEVRDKLATMDLALADESPQTEAEGEAADSDNVE